MTKKGLRRRRRKSETRSWLLRRKRSSKGCRIVRVRNYYYANQWTVRIKSGNLWQLKMGTKTERQLARLQQIVVSSRTTLAKRGPAKSLLVTIRKSLTLFRVQVN